MCDIYRPIAPHGFGPGSNLKFCKCALSINLAFMLGLTLCREHGSINETWEPMALIRVYVWPTAERVFVDERCAADECNPWKG